MDLDIRRNTYDDGSQDLLTGEQSIRNFNIRIYETNYFTISAIT